MRNVDAIFFILSYIYISVICRGYTDILKLKFPSKVDVHEALTVGAGWRERQPWETEGRVASPTPFHIFSLFFFFLC